MYQVKPTSVEFDIKVPNCMYKVKVPNSTLQLNGGFGSHYSDAFEKLEQNINNLISKTDMEMIESRQKVLIDQLHKFKERLAEIRKKLKLDEKSGKITIKTNTEKQFKNKTFDLFDNQNTQIDIVVNAHPKMVPYSLLALKNAWKNLVNISVEVFSHSTLLDITPEAKYFQKQITSKENELSNLPKINITLIWKNCEHTEMVGAPTMYKPIYGEINILRFLCRIGPHDFRYDFYLNATQIDLVLDICYKLLGLSGNAAQELINVISEELGTQKFFGGENLCIADIAVSSTLKKLPQAISKSLPEQMKKWQNTVKTILY